MIDPEMYLRVWKVEHEQLVASAARNALVSRSRRRNPLARLGSRLGSAGGPAQSGQ